ncbi:MAG TPA: M1 family aminopeptidase [Candidatus Baltobacteraceae bacterium]|nr:M1 family aminopeptidase [Candidatus Baltobacteraceae bacterium]
MSFVVALGVALLALVTSVAPTPQPRPFGMGHVWFHPTAFAPYRFENTILRVHFDFARGIVYGDETAIVHAKRSGVRILPFNTLGIHYRRVTVNGEPASYTFDAKHQLINVRLPQPAAADARLSVEFTYWTQPARGVYFIRPDKGYPDVTPEIWSQGEMIDNRRWFPTWDEPNEKTPSELIVTVPHGWTVVANGTLRVHTRDGSNDVWDWDSPHPKSTYLIAFAAGPLSEHHTALGTLPVDSYVQPRYANLNALCFGDTKDIVGYFQHLLNVPFPWAKYDQTTAERFTYGGMENASATIQTDRALHPAIENLESPCDGLVAHELAHQWFGDDASLEDWANTWLNEGYATYFEELWSEKHFGEAQFEYERYDAQQEYFKETNDYYRPIVDYVYNDPLNLFDASGYPRPGQVLHMLRYMYGDARFFGALHDYLIAYQYRNATTPQFFAVMDKSLGTDLTWFEREWFYRAAYPHYYVTQTYDAAHRALRLDVRQKNHDGKPFRMPVVIEAYFNGYARRVQPIIERNRQIVTIAGVTSKPQMVLFDPDNNVLRKLTFRKSVADLAYQSVHAAHVGDREWALEQLSDFAKRKSRRERAQARAAVDRMTRSDPFYGVRADAVAVSATFGDSAAVLAALRDADKRVRLAAEDASGDLKHPGSQLLAALRVMTSDPDPNVAGGAFAALGALKAPDAYALLASAVRRPSFRETIASGALRGLGALGDMRAFGFIEARTAYGTPEYERGAAVAALAKLAAHAKKPQLALGTLLQIVQRDPNISTRIAAAKALGTLGDPAAIPVLRRVQDGDSQQAVQRNAWNAILTIEDTQRMHALKH